MAISIGYNKAQDGKSILREWGDRKGLKRQGWWLGVLGRNSLKLKGFLVKCECGSENLELGSDTDASRARHNPAEEFQGGHLRWE